MPKTHHYHQLVGSSIGRTGVSWQNKAFQLHSEALTAERKAKQTDLKHAKEHCNAQQTFLQQNEDLQLKGSACDHHHLQTPLPQQWSQCHSVLVLLETRRPSLQKKCRGIRNNWAKWETPAKFWMLSISQLMEKFEISTQTAGPIVQPDSWTKTNKIPHVFPTLKHSLKRRTRKTLFAILRALADAPTGNSQWRNSTSSL